MKILILQYGGVHHGHSVTVCYIPYRNFSIMHGVLIQWCLLGALGSIAMYETTKKFEHLLLAILGKSDLDRKTDFL